MNSNAGRTSASSGEIRTGHADEKQAGQDQWRPGQPLLLTTMAELAILAGRVVMDVFVAGPKARYKADHTPVCEADEAAEQIIVAGLAAHFPDLPIVAEEASSRGDAPACAGDFFLVDPLDGTREFISLNGEFTVNVALVRDGVPRAGVVFAPMMGRLWVGSSLEPGHEFAAAGPASAGGPTPRLDELETIHGRPRPATGPVALVSRSHPDTRIQSFLDGVGSLDRRPMGSSLKFCLLAEGVADVYPRFSPTMEWDTAAGDAVLRAAGGIVLDEEGKPLAYGKAGQGFRNSGFVAWGAPPDGSA